MKKATPVCAYCGKDAQLHVWPEEQAYSLRWGTLVLEIYCIDCDRWSKCEFDYARSKKSSRRIG